MYESSGIEERSKYIKAHDCQSTHNGFFSEKQIILLIVLSVVSIKSHVK